MEVFFLALLLICAVVVISSFSQGAGDKKTNTNEEKKLQDPSARDSPAKIIAIKPKAHQPKVDHAPPPPIPASRELRGRAYVIDGDTIKIGKIKIRLAGIDAPELDRPWGQKSKWEMVHLCKGHTVRVALTGETSYDRLVGTCFLPDGTDIGAEIIKAGLALDGGYYSKGKYRHLEPEGIRRKLKPYGNRSLNRD